MFGINSLGQIIMAVFDAAKRDTGEVFNITSHAITYGNVCLLVGDMVINEQTREIGVVLATKPKTSPVYGDERDYIYVESFKDLYTRMSEFGAIEDTGTSGDFWLLDDVIPVPHMLEPLPY